MATDPDSTPDPPDPLVTSSMRDGVCTITLDSPSNRNALSTRLVAELHTAISQARRTRPRSLVLTHTGPVFCAGADLKERAASAGPIDPSPMIEVLRALMDAPFVTIAAARGPVRAGGMGLMAACDLVVVADDVSFQLTEVRIGVAPAIISVPLLRRCPPGLLRSAFLTGEPFDAAQARSWGLVTHSVSAAEVDATVDRLCDAIQAGGPEAIAATKRLLDDVPSLSIADAFASMAALSSALFEGPEAAVGIAAFGQRSTPEWPHQSPEH